MTDVEVERVTDGGCFDGNIRIIVNSHSVATIDDEGAMELVRLLKAETCPPPPRHHYACDRPGCGGCG